MPLQPNTVEHFCSWAGGLKLRSGEPWIVEDFQASFAADFFDPTFFECWLIVPEGNAKTNLANGLGLYHCEFTPWASVAVAAASRDQAKTDWDAASGFVRRSGAKPGAMLEGFTVHPGLRQIRYVPGGSELQIWAADSRTVDGIDPTMELIDELHRHRDLEMYRTWRGKLQKSGGRLIVISTAGEPYSEFETAREEIRQQGTITHRTETYLRVVTDEGVVLHEYAVPEKGDVENLELVKRANPLEQITVRSLSIVRNAPGQTLDHWRRFNCNLPTRSESAAIAEGEWFDAAVDDAIPQGQPVWLGADIAWKWDTTALVPLWIREPTDRLLGPAEVLVPPRDGTSLDPNAVEAALLRLHARNPIHTVVMDPTKAEQLAEWIRDELGATVLEHGQTNTFAATDYERFMEALREGWLHHTGDKALTRHVLNAVARLLPGGGIRFDRPTRVRRGGEQDMRVIDALSAAAMVHTVAAADLLTVEREPLVAVI